MHAPIFPVKHRTIDGGRALDYNRNRLNLEGLLCWILQMYEMKY